MQLVPDQNKGPTLVASVWACNALSIIFVSCRVFTRVKLTDGPGIDDAVILLSLALGLTAGGIETAAVSFGMGRHAIYLTPYNLSRALEYNTISQPFLILGFSVPKIAVALLLFRFMKRQARFSRWFIGSLVSSLVVLTMVNAVFVFVECYPINAAWTPGKKATCWPNNVTMDFNVSVVVYSAVIDLVLAFYPIVVFWDLKLSWRKKMFICCIMGAGVFAAACALVKVTFLEGLTNHADLTFSTVDLFLWGNIENSLIIIAACVPTLMPLVQYIRGKQPNTTILTGNGIYATVAEERQGWKPRNTELIELSATTRSNKSSRLPSSTPSPELNTTSYRSLPNPDLVKGKDGIFRVRDVAEEMNSVKATIGLDF